jgi:hypothetical protein
MLGLHARDGQDSGRLWQQDSHLRAYTVRQKGHPRKILTYSGNIVMEKKLNISKIEH